MIEFGSLVVEMTEQDFDIVCSKIDEEKDFLNLVSQDIWKMPELQFKEVHAHAVLTSALKKYGFHVEKHYFLTTAFRAEYRSRLVGGSTVAILLEYDALPDIGHACGHNLIAEAGLAAAMAVKRVMEQDPKLAGKIVVLGTPAEEGGGGKIRLIELGAFDGVDAALMVHPTRRSVHNPASSARIKCSVQFNGKESHSGANPWEGRNALDAAVACYNNLSMLRQQTKTNCRIQVIITDGGVVTNIVPAKAKLEIALRAPTLRETKELQSRVEACISGAALATGCTADYSFDEPNACYDLISNEVIANIFRSYSEKLGIVFMTGDVKNAGTTDMGNVSHLLPSIHPYYSIPSQHGNHTKGFAEAAGNLAAQEPTLKAAKALAMTCLDLLRNEDTLEKAKKRHQEDIADEMKS